MRAALSMPASLQLLPCPTGYIAILDAKPSGSRRGPWLDAPAGDLDHLGFADALERARRVALVTVYPHHGG